MSRWGTVFLLVLAVGVAALLVFFEPGVQALRPASAKRTQLIDFDPMDLKGVRISSGSETVELSRQADGWTVGPAPDDRADSGRVGELLMTISGITIHDTIPGSEIRSEKDLRPFGLHDPRIHIEVLGSRSVKVSFGKEAVGEGRIYAQVQGDTSVYVVSNPMEDGAIPSKQELRDRRLTRYDATMVDQLILRSPNGELEIKRLPQGWNIIRPLMASADSERVTALLNGLLGAGIGSFSTDSKQKPPGPDQSDSIEVVFYPDDSDDADRVWLRADSDADGNPVTIVFYPARASVFVLDSGYHRLASVTPDQVRCRKLLPLNLDMVDMIRIERGGHEIARWKRESDHWTRAETGETTSSADVAATLAQLLNQTVSAYEIATQDTLLKGQINDQSLSVFFDAIASENTPEAAAGTHPISQLKIGSTDTQDTFVQVNLDSEICRIPSASVHQFLDWALADRREHLPQSTP